ncbi:hypothetical protein F7725_011473 [Dissostichus mawsoni]|uniref:Uncharacterized protein n=1 Tax=Dissostichus mawsoni TaxID=36200 RepID=A0A7J5Z8Y4_DISMA|nr:hypothetical protein F7725_011473 [Dissostichus mawsoni]
MKTLKKPVDETPAVVVARVVSMVGHRWGQWGFRGRRRQAAGIINQGDLRRGSHQGQEDRQKNQAVQHPQKSEDGQHSKEIPEERREKGRPGELRVYEKEIVNADTTASHLMMKSNSDPASMRMPSSVEIAPSTTGANMCSRATAERLFLLPIACNVNGKLHSDAHRGDQDDYRDGAQLDAN